MKLSITILEFRNYEFSILVLINSPQKLLQLTLWNSSIKEITKLNGDQYRYIYKWNSKLFTKKIMQKFNKLILLDNSLSIIIFSFQIVSIYYNQFYYVCNEVLISYES